MKVPAKERQMTEHKRRANKASFFYERIGKTQFKKKQTREKNKFIVYRVKLMLTDDEVNSIFLFSALPRVFTFFSGFFFQISFFPFLCICHFLFFYLRISVHLLPVFMYICHVCRLRCHGSSENLFNKTSQMRGRDLHQLVCDMFSPVSLLTLL